MLHLAEVQAEIQKKIILKKSVKAKGNLPVVMRTRIQLSEMRTRNPA